MSTANVVLKEEALGYALVSGQFFDDGFSTFYNVGALAYINSGLE